MPKGTVGHVLAATASGLVVGLMLTAVPAHASKLPAQPIPPVPPTPCVTCGGEPGVVVNPPPFIQNVYDGLKVFTFATGSDATYGELQCGLQKFGCALLFWNLSWSGRVQEVVHFDETNTYAPGPEFEYLGTYNEAQWHYDNFWVEVYNVKSAPFFTWESGSVTHEEGATSGRVSTPGHPTNTDYPSTGYGAYGLCLDDAHCSVHAGCDVIVTSEDLAWCGYHQDEVYEVNIGAGARGTVLVVPAAGTGASATGSGWVAITGYSQTGEIPFTA